MELSGGAMNSNSKTNIRSLIHQSVSVKQSQDEVIKKLRLTGEDKRQGNDRFTEWRDQHGRLYFRQVREK